MVGLQHTLQHQKQTCRKQASTPNRMKDMRRAPQCHLKPGARHGSGPMSGLHRRSAMHSQAHSGCWSGRRGRASLTGPRVVAAACSHRTSGGDLPTPVEVLATPPECLAVPQDSPPLPQGLCKEGAGAEEQLMDRTQNGLTSAASLSRDVA